MSTTNLVIRCSDDWHLHLRDGSIMKTVVPYSSDDYGRAFIIPNEIVSAAASGLIKARKLYPTEATTNSESGVQDIKAVMPVFEKMADIGLPLLVHGEVTEPDVDIFDREEVFIGRVLNPLRCSLPDFELLWSI